METPRLGDAAPAVSLVAGMPMAMLAGAADDARRASAKRLVDLIGAGIALLAALPVFLTALVALRLERAGPALTRELRYGRNNVTFQALLFRADSGLGQALTALELRGLPLLINVLRGEMALVGPQGRCVGLLVDGVDPFTRFSDYAYRHRVKPGLIGLAQANGLGDGEGGPAQLDASLAFDLDYVRRHDLWLDLSILLRTLPAVIGVQRNAG
jgi:lipopolysaccharide/colanic/teichoic acid biosynthesis glycosyltransferase